MDKVQSFTVDHTTLEKGVYVARRDVTAGNYKLAIVTYDVRMKAPYRDGPMPIEVLHTLEHMGAYYLRLEDDWASRVVYWGPMGCGTGFYLITRTQQPMDRILRLLIRTFTKMASHTGPVPGMTKEQCGNYTCCDKDRACEEAKQFLSVLRVMYDEYVNCVKK